MTSFLMFETTGTIDENGVLQVEPFEGVRAGKVRVQICIPLTHKPDNVGKIEETEVDTGVRGE